jgi:hypothetical protein
VPELIRVVEPFDGVAGPLAAETPAQAVVRVRLYLYNLAVPHVDEHAAADGAKTAARFFNDFGHHLPRSIPDFPY